MKTRKDRKESRQRFILSLMTEFGTFMSNGTVVEMAIGYVFGIAFTMIVESIVGDIFNPILGYFLGGVNFSDLRIVLKAATETENEVAIRYGSMIQSLIQLMLTCLALFFFVKGINKLHEKAEADQKAKKAKLDGDNKQ